MNTKARHERRRLQTPAHPCWCAIHRGGNATKGYGHAIGRDRVALSRQVGGVLETGPWFDESGEMVDATITRQPAPHWGPAGPIRVTRRIRMLRALSRLDRRMSRQASRNPKFPATAYRAAVAEWTSAGATVTPDGPIYRARIVPDVASTADQTTDPRSD